MAVIAAAGAASKESVVVLPGLIILYELVFHKYAGWKPERRRTLLLGCLATIIPIAAVLLLRAAVLRMSPPAEFPFTDDPIVGAGFWHGRLTALNVIGRYMRLLLWPAVLSADYSFAQVPLVAEGLAP